MNQSFQILEISIFVFELMLSIILSLYDVELWLFDLSS